MPCGESVGGKEGTTRTSEPEIRGNMAISFKEEIEITGGLFHKNIKLLGIFFKESLVFDKCYVLCGMLYMYYLI